MADVTKDKDGNIISVIRRDYAGYSARIDAPDKSTGRLRITTTGKSGAGSPVDFEPREARKFAHDLLDMAGPDD